VDLRWAGSQLSDRLARPWPVTGGPDGPPQITHRVLLVTGHLDGSIRFWDASQGDLRLSVVLFVYVVVFVHQFTSSSIDASTFTKSSDTCKLIHVGKCSLEHLCAIPPCPRSILGPAIQPGWFTLHSRANSEFDRFKTSFHSIHNIPPIALSPCYRRHLRKISVCSDLRTDESSIVLFADENVGVCQLVFCPATRRLVVGHLTGSVLLYQLARNEADVSIKVTASELFFFPLVLTAFDLRA
jgi:hypothetical protein